MAPACEETERKWWINATGLNLSSEHKTGKAGACAAALAADENLWGCLGAAGPRCEPPCSFRCSWRALCVPLAASIAVGAAVPEPLGSWGGETGSPSTENSPKPAMAPHCPQALWNSWNTLGWEMQLLGLLLVPLTTRPKQGCLRQQQEKCGPYAAPALLAQQGKGGRAQPRALKEHNKFISWDAALWKCALYVTSTSSNKLIDSGRNKFYFLICFLQKCLMPFGDWKKIHQVFNFWNKGNLFI